MEHILIPCAACGAKNRIPVERQHERARCGRCGQALSLGAAARPVELTDHNFHQMVHASRLPVLVDFYSPTCGPCRVLAPVIDELAREFAGQALVAKLDTSRNQLTAGRFGIRGVPTLLFFKNGEVVDQVVGAAPAQEIAARLRRIV